jgi:hypothetical protein
MKMLLAIVAALLLSPLAPLARAADSPFAFTQISDTGLQLSEEGKPVYVYNFGPILKAGFPERMRRSTYLHPVYAPDGTIVTDDFNKDHPHHRGIFWAWEEVTVDGKKDDVWTVKGYKEKFLAWKAREANADSGRLVVQNGWFAGDKKFVDETAEITTHPVKDNHRVIDFTLTFEATNTPVIICGTHDSNKGYGGFAFRTAPRDGGEKQTAITTDKGVLPKDGIREPTPWAQVAGLFDGKPESIRIDDNPANPGFPNTGWLLRHGFAMLNPSYPALTPVTLEHDKPLVLRYKVTITSGELPK